MPQNQKSPEQVQAQVAVYASTQIEHIHPGRQRALVHELGQAVTYSTAPDETTYPRTVALKEFTDTGTITIKPKGHPEPLLIKSEYVELMRRPERHRQVANLAEMITAYGDFSDDIAGISIFGIDLETAKSHPNFLGSGGSEMAFTFEHAYLDNSSKKFVVRCEQNPESINAHSKVNQRATALALGIGINGLEQGTAVSFDLPVVISEFVPGKAMSGLSDRERAEIPRDHWQKLAETIKQASFMGIAIDTNKDNFLYEPEMGFTIIDYRLGDPGDSEGELRRNSFYTFRLFEELGLDTELLTSMGYTPPPVLEKDNVDVSHLFRPIGHV